MQLVGTSLLVTLKAPLLCTGCIDSPLAVVHVAIRDVVGTMLAIAVSIPNLPTNHMKLLSLDTCLKRFSFMTSLVSFIQLAQTLRFYSLVHFKITYSSFPYESHGQRARLNDGIYGTLD